MRCRPGLPIHPRRQQLDCLVDIVLQFPVGAVRFVLLRGGCNACHRCLEREIRAPACRLKNGGHASRGRVPLGRRGWLVSLWPVVKWPLWGRLRWPEEGRGIGGALGRHGVSRIRRNGLAISGPGIGRRDDGLRGAASIILGSNIANRVVWLVLFPRWLRCRAGRSVGLKYSLGRGILVRMPGIA